jgi:monoamine oxidase
MDGGYAALAEALAKTLPPGAIRFGADARKIAKRAEGGVVVECGGVTVSASRAVVAIPPRVAIARVAFEPALPEDQAAQMRGTQTWAGDWCKVVASFKENFWRKNGDAGVAKFGANALLAVTWEAADPDDLGEKGACLAGVNFGAAACERLLRFGAHADPKTGRSGDALRAAVKKDLGSVFGEAVVDENLVAVYHQAWTGEEHTWHDGDGGALARGDDPRRLYGHPALRKIAPWGVHFAGTETESKSGHVDGAVAAGERAASEIKSALAKQAREEEEL